MARSGRGGGRSSGDRAASRETARANAEFEGYPQAPARSVNVTDRALDAMVATVFSEVSGITAGKRGNVDRVVDSIIGRAEVGRRGVGGFPTSIEDVVNQGKGTKSPQYSGIGKAGGWENWSKANLKGYTTEEIQKTKDAIISRLGEIAAIGRTTLSPSFANAPHVASGKAGSSTKTKADVKGLAASTWTGPLPVTDPLTGKEKGAHVYGMTPSMERNLAAGGIRGPGIDVNLTFSGQLAPAVDREMATNYSDYGKYGTPRESLAQPFSGRQVNADYQDYTDVLANEQIGVPDLPGPLQGMPAPEFSLADLGGIPDRSMGSFYDSAPDYSDISRGILHDTDQARGFTGSLNAPDYDPNVGLQPDYSDISRAVFGDQAPRNGIGLGVTGYDPGALGTAAMPAIGDYDPLGAARDAYGPSVLADPLSPSLTGAPQGFGNYGNAPIGYSPDTFSGAPMQTQPATPDVFSGQPMGAPQSFGNYGAGEIGYPSGGFASKPATATDMSLAGLSPVGQGVVGVGYNPSVVAAAEPIGAPAARGMSFDQMTRGIVGYEDKPVTTTTQVANPAWSEWSKDFTKNNALQEAYLNDEMDRHGPAKPTNVPNYEWSPEPARTVSRTTTTTQRSPVYGDVPVGQPIGANLSQAGAGSWTSGLTNQANTIGAQINDFSNFGLEGFTGNFGTGIGDPSGGMSLGGLGGVGGGFSGALGGSYGPGGQPLGGSENQGGAGYGGSFSGSQGSDPSGRGGLY